MTDQPRRSVSRALGWEAALFVMRLAPVVTAFGVVTAAINWWAGDAVSAWLAMPDRLARIEARLGEVPEAPFAEFQPNSQMWPDEVRPGQIVSVVYVLRRNRDCKVTVERRFQRVDAVTVDSALTSRGSASVPPLTLGFELFSIRLAIPDAIVPGFYAYRPILHCPNEVPVEPPATFFEVTA